MSTHTTAPLVATSMSAPSMSAPSMSNSDWLRLLVLSFLWGGSFFFAEVAVASIPPLTLAWARVGLAAFALLLVMTLLGLLTGMVQAYIFSILAAVYIAAATQVREPDAAKSGSEQ